MIKIENFKFKLKRLPTLYDYYKNNIISLPTVRSFLCKMGQHDMELEMILNSHDVELQCVHCSFIKRSTSLKITINP